MLSGFAGGDFASLRLSWAAQVWHFGPHRREITACALVSARGPAASQPFTFSVEY